MSNTNRLDHLKELLEDGNVEGFNRLTYEWVKTGVFTRADLAKSLALVYEFAYNNGRSENEEEVVIEGL